MRFRKVKYQLISCIKSTEGMKYLGLAWEYHLRWNIHVQYLTITLTDLLHNFQFLSLILHTKEVKTNIL